MRTCEICNATKHSLLYSIPSFSEKFDVNKCAECGHIFRHPLPSKKDITAMYGEVYFSDDEKAKTQGAFTYTDERKQKMAFAAVNKKRVNFILQKCTVKPASGRTFVDIGCSFGSLLESASEAGWETAGMDISPYAVEHLNNQGIHAICGNPEQGNIPSPAAVITMIEVIEHLESPATALRNIYSALMPQGLLVIQTANMAGRQAKKAGKEYHYFLPGHLHYFTRENLIRLLEDTGFTHIKTYYPCEFGLLPKLKKSRAGFTRLRDYTRWLRIILYHLKSKIHCGNFALTSGMVVYARKP